MNAISRLPLPLAVVTALLLVLNLAGARAAAIFATSPMLTEIAPPASVFEGALEDNDTAFVFREEQNFLLTQNLAVDAANLGAFIFPDGTGGVPGLIPAGTRVDSFFIHYDSEGQPMIAEFVQWALTFRPNDQILGLIYSDDRLDNSDYLGAPGTAYPAGLDFRGTTGALEGPDNINWASPVDVIGDQTVTVAVDQIRVILAVPEPAAVLSLLLASVAIAGRRTARRPR